MAGSPPSSESAREAGAGAPRTHHDLLHGRDVPLDTESRKRRQLKHDLAARVRGINEAVAMLDALECEPAELQPLIDQARDLEDHLDRLPDLRGHGGAARAPRGASALDERSPISGRGNPLAPPLHLECDGITTWGHATYGIAYEGPPLHLHGGWVLAAFDEVLGVAQAVAGAPGMTGTLTVRLRAPTPLHERIDYEAWLERTEGRKLFARGEARLEGRVLAEAEGIFVAPSDWTEATRRPDDPRGGPVDPT